MIISTLSDVVLLEKMVIVGHRLDSEEFAGFQLERENFLFRDVLSVSHHTAVEQGAPLDRHQDGRREVLKYC